MAPLPPPTNQELLNLEHEYRPYYSNENLSNQPPSTILIYGPHPQSDPRFRGASPTGPDGTTRTTKCAGRHRTYHYAASRGLAGSQPNFKGPRPLLRAVQPGEPPLCPPPRDPACSLRCRSPDPPVLPIVQVTGALPSHSGGARGGRAIITISLLTGTMAVPGRTQERRFHSYAALPGLARPTTISWACICLLRPQPLLTLVIGILRQLFYLRLLSLYLRWQSGCEQVQSTRHRLTRGRVHFITQPTLANHSTPIPPSHPRKRLTLYGATLQCCFPKSRRLSQLR